MSWTYFSVMYLFDLNNIIICGDAEEGVADRPRISGQQVEHQGDAGEFDQVEQVSRGTDLAPLCQEGTRGRL